MAMHALSMLLAAWTSETKLMPRQPYYPFQGANNQRKLVQIDNPDCMSEVQRPTMSTESKLFLIPSAFSSMVSVSVHVTNLRLKPMQNDQ